MKCGFCGKELAEGAEFCPECGMILSLGGVTNEPDEVKTDEFEVPEYTPNVFMAMDFEEESNEPAMELEAADEEETAEVVEIIPEHTESEETKTEEPVTEEPSEEAGEEVAEEVYEQEITEEEFVAPEYDPDAAVSDEFLQQVEAGETDLYEEKTEEAAEIAEEAEFEAEEEFAPPEYDGELSESAAVYEIADDEEEVVEAYPVYDEEDNAAIAEEAPAEDASLFASLFENEEAEKIEDITPDSETAPKKSKNNFGAVIAVVVILACVITGGAFIFKNVLPGINKPTEFSTTETGEKVDATTENKNENKTTTEKTTDKKETTTKETTTKETTTKETTTKETTTKETTTEKVTQTTTGASGELTVVEPSEYNLDYVAFFPKDGDIGIKARPSATSAEMMTHPYGYPVFAYAKEGNYYYVHSAYHDFMGWVYAEDLVKYNEETGQTEAAESEEETTTKADEAEATEAPETESATEAATETTAATEAEVTDTPESDSEVSYVAMINSDYGLNFRSGPGAEYSADYVVPGGFYVRVTAVSEDDPAWVYVTVEDDRYPYGTPSGWVLAEYLV